MLAGIIPRLTYERLFPLLPIFWIPNNGGLYFISADSPSQEQKNQAKYYV